MSQTEKRDDEVVVDEGDDFDWISIDPGDSRDEFDVPFALLPESDRARTLSNSALGDDTNNHEPYAPKRKAYREIRDRSSRQPAPEQSPTYIESAPGFYLISTLVAVGVLGVYMWTRRR